MKELYSEYLYLCGNQLRLRYLELIFEKFERVTDLLIETTFKKNPEIIHEKGNLLEENMNEIYEFIV